MFNWFAFVSYVVVSSITPGPNNLMCMANGTRYGFRKGLKFCFGVALGFSLIVLCAIGCNFFINEYIPAILKLMTPIGAAYILWLAWTIWRDKPKEKKESKLQLDTTAFHVGMILQFVNPKGLLFGMTLITNFVFPYDRSFGMFAMVVIFCWAMVLLSNICWLLFGSIFQKFFEDYKRILNAVMALLLVYCAVSLFL
ncbi:LysE family transporter [Anaerotignum sp.]|nr:LysE family transporter [Anaerotignum sp.]MBQ7758136.1 LysE family transporter [Anaerotignum sp.]